MGEHLPVRENSGNFDDWKSQGILHKILENQGILDNFYFYSVIKMDQIFSFQAHLV